MWPFTRKPRLDPGNIGFDETPGTYHAVWEQKRMPDPGAQPFAWEALGLPPFTPIGPAVANRDQIRATFSQLYSLQAVPLQGMPIVAGQIFGQPLYDPDQDKSGGYVGGDPVAISPLVSHNIPASVAASIGPNNPFPDNIKDGPV